eukprot:CAMPEP_0194392062 /NCGR_PEP_ID=MMETSP0174-20130528/119478_1 /TAXON_ID=216777 /ORGANISM="Proboscia alata, Strain PI-D3" /LENGTH=33 /DNA_ID= /DNA_START= /DNA_END= /DNA_ORIENTATION=
MKIPHFPPLSEDRRPHEHHAFRLRRGFVIESDE